MFRALILALCLATTAQAQAADWEDLGVTDGVKVERKVVPTSDFIAFRGEKLIDLPIGQLVAWLLDDPRSVEWVDLQFLSREIRRLDENNKVIHQGFALPWPISDRDYVMRETAAYDDEAKVFTLYLISVVDPAVPERDDFVRAEVMRTFWRLTVREGGQTFVEVEVLTDPKGHLPVWIVNMIQKDWPHLTINGLERHTRANPVAAHPQVATW
jgi:hypothetical protein